MSASSRPVLRPLAARPSARLTAVVDLPTPPLPEATAMMCLTPGTSMRPPPPVVLAAGPWLWPWPCACAGAGGCGGGAFGGHDGGGRQHARHGADRLFAGLAQRLQGGAAGRIDVEGDGDMAAADGDPAQQAGAPPRSVPVAGSMTVSRTLRMADSVNSAMIARFRYPANSCRRLIEGVAVVTYMQPGVKSKAAMRRGSRPGGPEVNDGVE